MILPLVLIPLGFVSPDHWPVAVIGLVLLAALAWVRWKDKTSPRAVRLTGDTIENLDRWRWNSADARTLSLTDVESVRVYRSGKDASLVVVLESDRGSMHLGQGYSRADLTWLRDFLIAQIALRARRAK